jgi:hypothetical protein
MTATIKSLDPFKFEISKDNKFEIHFNLRVPRVAPKKMNFLAETYLMGTDLRKVTFDPLELPQMITCDSQEKFYSLLLEDSDTLIEIIRQLQDIADLNPITITPAMMDLAVINKMYNMYSK